MKLYGDVTNDVDLNNITNIQDFHIEEPHKVILTILDNAYSNPVEAMVREICQNASEVDENFRVHLPTDLEPWFSVIDNGTGMSPEDCYRYASGVGASTKDDNNDKVGGFGIGMKVPFTVSDQYLVISRWNGVEYTFNAFKDEHGLPRFVQTSQRDTDRHNGLEVQVPIESGQFSTTKRALLKMLEYFKDKPATNTEVEWPSTEYSVEGTNYGMVSRRGGDNENRWNYNHGSRIIMGNLWYALDGNEISESYNDNYQWLTECGIDLFMPIGSVSLPLSREAILYTPATIKLIREKLDVVALELTTKLQAEVDAQPNVYAVMKFMAEGNNLLHRRGGSTKDKYTYRGQAAHVNMELYDVASLDVYDVEPSRFRLKSLNLQNYNMYVKTDSDTKRLFIRTGYSKKPLLILMLDKEESKRVPSRLLRHVKETYDDEDTPRVLLFSYTKTTKVKVKRWIDTTFGVTPDTFEDVVDEYTPVRGAAGTRKKVAKVKVMSRVNGYWSDHAGDLDLDSNRGVYVDLRRDNLYGTEYHWVGNQLNAVSDILKEYDLIPEDGQLYGCPGSHKNKLADHPNYIHLDDAISMVLEGAKSLFSVAERTRMNYLVSLKHFVSGNNDIFNLDIDVEGSYYNSYRDRVKAYEDNIVTTSTTPNIETYNSAKRLSKILRVDGREETYKDYEEDIEAKFNKKYPILRAVHTRRSHYYDEDEKALLLTDLQEYVAFKTTTTNPNP